MTTDNIVRLTSYLRDPSYAAANGAARERALGSRRIPTTAIVVQNSRSGMARRDRGDCRGVTASVGRCRGASRLHGLQEGARDGVARPVRRRGVPRGDFGVAIEPAGRHPLGDVGKHRQPGFDDLDAGLEVELHAVGGAADAEALVGDGRARHEPHGLVGQGERVDMPVEALEPGAEVAEQRIGRTLRA